MVTMTKRLEEKLNLNIQEFSVELPIDDGVVSIMALIELCRISPPNIYKGGSWAPLLAEQ